MTETIVQKLARLRTDYARERDSLELEVINELEARLKVAEEALGKIQSEALAGVTGSPGLALGAISFLAFQAQKSCDLSKLWEAA